MLGSKNAAIYASKISLACRLCGSSDTSSALPKSCLGQKFFDMKFPSPALASLSSPCIEGCSVSHQPRHSYARTAYDRPMCKNILQSRIPSLHGGLLFFISQRSKESSSFCLDSGVCYVYDFHDHRGGRSRPPLLKITGDCSSTSACAQFYSGA